MKIRVYTLPATLLLVGLTGSASDICSPDSRTILQGFGTNLKQLDAHCKKPTPSKATSSVDYDLVSGKNDFAEVVDDLTNGKAIGKHITLRLTNFIENGHYCISGEVTQSGKQTLACQISPGGALVDIYSTVRDIRIDLQKDRPTLQTPIITGIITEQGFPGRPVIEISTPPKYDK